MKLNFFALYEGKKCHVDYINFNVDYVRLSDKDGWFITSFDKIKLIPSKETKKELDENYEKFTIEEKSKKKDEALLKAIGHGGVRK